MELAALLDTSGGLDNVRVCCRRILLFQIVWVEISGFWTTTQMYQQSKKIKQVTSTQVTTTTPLDLVVDIGHDDPRVSHKEETAHL